MAPDGGDQTRLTVSDGSDMGASWSADGTRILFASDREGQNDVYTLEVATGDVTRLTDDPADEIFPVWVAATE